MQDSTTTVHGAVLLMVQHLRHLCCGALHSSGMYMRANCALMRTSLLACVQHLCLMSQQVSQSQDKDISVTADLILGVAELLHVKIEAFHPGHEGCPKVARQPANCSFQPLFAQMSGQLHQTWQQHNNRNKLMKGVFVCTLTRPCLGRPRLR